MSNVVNLRNKPEMEFEECVIEWYWRADYPSVLDGPEYIAEAISAMNLHRFLNIGQSFCQWLADSLTALGYEIDCDDDCHSILGDADEIAKDYALSIRAAREIALLSNAENSIEAIRNLHLLQWHEDCRVSNNHLDNMRKVLTSPSYRKQFINSYMTRHHDIGIEWRSFSPSEIKEQRIINELLFTPDVLNKINGMSEPLPF